MTFINFPQHPLQVRLGLKQWAALAGAALVGITVLLWCAYITVVYGVGLVRDTETWSQGRVAPIRAWHGHCLNYLSLLPVSNCTVAVEYDAPGGSTHSQEVSALLFAGLSSDVAPELRINPENPSRIAISWFSAARERWLVIILLCAISVGLGALICGSLFKGLYEWRLYAAMGRNPRPILVQLQSMRHISSPNYAREYSFSYEADGEMRIGRQRLRVIKGEHGVPPEQWEYEDPIVLKSNPMEALALLGPRNSALLVPRSFRPLVLTKDEQVEVLASAARA